MVEGENQIPKVVLWPRHLYYGISICAIKETKDSKLCLLPRPTDRNCIFGRFSSMKKFQKWWLRIQWISIRNSRCCNTGHWEWMNRPSCWIFIWWPLSLTKLKNSLVSSRGLHLVPSPFFCVCVVCTCVCVYVMGAYEFVYIYVEVRSPYHVTLSITLHLSIWDRISLNLHLMDSARLAAIKLQGAPFLIFSVVKYISMPACPALNMGAGIQTQVTKLLWQGICPLSQLFISPNSIPLEEISY